MRFACLLLTFAAAVSAACNADNCLRQVRASPSRTADCAAYQTTVVAGNTITVAGSTAGSPNASPKTKPAYASSCDEAAYRSACSCQGYPSTVIVDSSSTVTVTTATGMPMSPTGPTTPCAPITTTATTTVTVTTSSATPNTVTVTVTSTTSASSNAAAITVTITTTATTTPAAVPVTVTVTSTKTTTPCTTFVLQATSGDFAGSYFEAGSASGANTYVDTDLDGALRFNYRNGGFYRSACSDDVLATLSGYQDTLPLGTYYSDPPARGVPSRLRCTIDPVTGAVACTSTGPGGVSTTFATSFSGAVYFGPDAGNLTPFGLKAIPMCATL